MPPIANTLQNWEQSLCSKVELAALLSRNPVAYKWKSMTRNFTLRETIFWRLHDLLTQSYELHCSHSTLGARILLRSAFETLATLIHLNQLMAQVIGEKLSFQDFSDKTARLLLGSRNKTTSQESINILTILKHCDKKYPGIVELYSDLSESAHPNFEGMCFGYSSINFDEYSAVFSNNIRSMYENRHEPSIWICMTTFEHEYNEVWPDSTRRLEAWVEKNEEQLEASKVD